jgi:hypothetical protein
MVSEGVKQGFTSRFFVKGTKKVFVCAGFWTLHCASKKRTANENKVLMFLISVMNKNKINQD